jgi:hypothetical protein
MKKAVRSFLIVEKADFIQKLESRIALANNMLQQQIINAEVLAKLKTEISDWSDYNLELLKQSFDNPDNEYKQEYKNSYQAYSYAGTHSLADMANAQKRKISSYKNYLEKLINKIDLIPVKGVV